MDKAYRNCKVGSVMLAKNQCYIIAVFVICFVGFILRCESYAVPAAPITHTLDQSDGINFKARQWGDENLHGWETEDGYSVTFDENLNRWTYAVQSEDGGLISSSRIIGKDSPLDLPQHVRPKSKAQLLKRLSRELASESPQQALNVDRSVPQKVVPPTGTANVPVILINFKDRTTTYTAANFNNLLFGTGNYSMKDYYQEVSYGVFSVSAGPSGIAGWYTASNTHDYYGRNDIYGYDRWPGTLVREAVASADASFDFAPYDQDGDCYVDTVAIIHQGNGEESSMSSTDIWSHRWDLNSAYYYGYGNGGEYTTNDACSGGGYIKINDYIIQPETLLGGLTTMGTMTHEYGHALGLPDLYDTDYSSEGIGTWSLMAGGSWNYVTIAGDRPAHLDAWCKYDLGWVTPTQVSATLTTEPITSAATAADVYQLRNGSPSSGGEYFLVENRQKTGFDAGLPGAGLLVWHIDESVSTENDNECYPGGPSCTTNHYHVALVQADNLYDLEKSVDSGDTGDPYPGSTNNTSFTDSSSPNSKLYNGTSSKVSITNISTSGSTMTATLSMQGTVSGTAITQTLTPPSNTTVSQGSRLGPFSVSITNNISSSYTFYIFVYVGAPDGSSILLMAKQLTLSANGTLSANNRYLNIPSSAPTGTYSYYVAVSDTSYNVIDEDYFYFVVTAK